MNQPFHALIPARKPRFSHVSIAASFLLLCMPFGAHAQQLTLDSCVVSAMASNPALRATDRDVEAAGARVSQAGAFEPPSLSYEAGKRGTPVSDDEREISFRLSQDLGAIGTRGRARSVARTELGISEATRASLALKIRGDVTRAYRRLQADALSLRALESLRRTAADFEQMVNGRLHTGGARYLDVLRARSERARIENDVIEALRSLHEDVRTLNGLMARRADAPIEPADSLFYVPLTDSLPNVLRRALEERPRLRAARLEVERGESQLGLARRARVPAASVSAGLDRVPGTDNPGLGGGISFTLPFVPWADRGARIREATASKGSAEARLESSQREVEVLVRNAFESALAAERQVQQFDRILLADASDAIRTATQNYQAGQIDGLELFETLRTFRSIELEYIRALLNYELALTDLAVAE